MPNHYTTMLICSPGHAFDCDGFNEQHAETDLCSVVMPMPEQIEQIPRISYPDGTTEKQRRGEQIDWYDWARAHWGTKWGTYQVGAFELDGDGSPVLIKFQSAWGPPKILDKICEWLKSTYGFDDIAMIGFDPYDNSTQMLED